MLHKKYISHNENLIFPDKNSVCIVSFRLNQPMKQLCSRYSYRGQGAHAFNVFKPDCDLTDERLIKYFLDEDRLNKRIHGTFSRNLPGFGVFIYISPFLNLLHCARKPTFPMSINGSVPYVSTSSYKH